MNKNFVLLNLREAQEEIEKTIGDLETDVEYDEPQFLVAMMHLYHHVNTAWNARNSTPAQSKECSQDDFDRWRRCPSDEELLLV